MIVGPNYMERSDSITMRFLGLGIRRYLGPIKIEYLGPTIWRNMGPIRIKYLGPITIRNLGLITRIYMGQRAESPKDFKQ